MPFFVIDPKAPLPKDVKVKSYSRVLMHEDSIRRAPPGEGATYELMKGTQGTTGKPWEAAYDRDGKSVDFNRVRAGVRKPGWTAMAGCSRSCTGA